MIGAVAGFAVGILVSVLTDVPFAPEAGAILGGLIVLYWRRDELKDTSSSDEI